jgi:hypothetical protein
MVYFYDKIPDAPPDTAARHAAVFNCVYNENEQQPGAILLCDTGASALTGFSRQQILTSTFLDLCHDFPLLNPTGFDKNIHFRNEMYTFSGPPLLCDFFITAMYAIDAIILHIVVQPVSFDASQRSVPENTISSNKLELLDVLSHGFSHSINNSINLVTLSSDLLRELLDDLMSRFDSSIDMTIRGMSISDLSKMVHQLTDNLLKSSSKINTTSQALVHFLRGSEPIPVSSYDVRKILHAAVILTEHEINKSSYEFIYEPPQGIIKRTGNQHEILQAIFNCIVFLCKCTTAKNGRFVISSTVSPGQNSFIIQMQHDGAMLPENDTKLAALLKSPDKDELSDHPLSVARSLIVKNSGELMVAQARSGGVHISITFTTVSSFF